jgi:hypothetical protein
VVVVLLAHELDQGNAVVAEQTVDGLFRLFRLLAVRDYLGLDLLLLFLDVADAVEVVGMQSMRALALVPVVDFFHFGQGLQVHL